MIRSFALTEKFERRVNGVLFTKLDYNIGTSYGPVVAYENDTIDKKCTIVPGFYLEELSARFGRRRVRIRLVEQEQQDDISKILVELGYPEPIYYWPYRASQS